MAIRDDNTPPSRTPGSITQTADAQQDRIGNISNVSKTVANMQKDVKQRITETKEAVDNSKEISAIQGSMVNVLDKLSDTVNALKNGVRTVTTDTAKATKDAINDYGKAVSQDISFNKQSIVAMALARSTPIYGYFVAKFMETDVFKRAAERMKQSIGKAFGSLAGIFRRDGKKNKPTQEQFAKHVKGKIPHMAKGGVVGKEGVAKLHAAEVVMPIEKLLTRMDESNDATKNIGKFISRLTLQHAASTKAVSSMILHKDELEGKRKTGLFKDFFRIAREEKERDRNSIDVRQLRELIAIRESFGAEMKMWPEVWSRLLSNHPMFRNVIALTKSYASLMKLITWKPVYAIFKSRGGHARYLSRKQEPLEALNQNIGLLYVESMWRFDNMLNLLRAIAIATRATASKVTGKKFDRLKGIGTGEWSIAGVTARAVGLLTGGAMQLAGKIPGLSLLGKGGKALTRKSLTGRYGNVHSIEGSDLGPKEVKKIKRNPIYVDLHAISENFKKKQKKEDKIAPKKKKQEQKMFEWASQRTETSNAIQKGLKNKSWIQWLLIGFGFVKTMLSSWWNRTLGKILNKQALTGLGNVLRGRGFDGKGSFTSKKRRAKRSLSRKAGKFSKWMKGGVGVGAKLGGAAGMLAGGGMMGYDAYQAVQLAEQWKTSKIGAGIGGALGGTGQGIEGAISGVGKGASMGMGIGMFFGPLGAAIGGGIGAIVGGVLGFVGGKRIAGALDWIGKKLKPFVKVVTDVIMLPVNFIKDSIDIFKDGLSWDAIKKFSLRSLKYSWDTITAIPRSIWKFAKLVSPKLTGAIENMFTKIKNIAHEFFVAKPLAMWESAKRWVDELFSLDTLKTIISGLLWDYPKWLLKKIGGAFYWLADLVFDMDALKKDLTWLLNWPKNKIMGIWDSVTKWATEKFNIKSIKDTLMKPIDSFLGMFSWIGDIFTDIKNYIVDKISSVAGISSFFKNIFKGNKGPPDKAEQSKIKDKTANATTNIAELAETAKAKATKSLRTSGKFLSGLPPKAKKAFETAKKYYMSEFGWTENQANAILETIATTAGDKINKFSDPEKLKNMASGLMNAGDNVAGAVKDRFAAMIDSGHIVVNEAKLMLANGEMIADDIGKKIMDSSKELGEKSIQGTKAVVNSVNTVTTNIAQTSNANVSGGGRGSKLYDPSGYFDQMVFTGNYR